MARLSWPASLLLILVPVGLGLARDKPPAELLQLGWLGLVRQSLEISCGPAVIATLARERGTDVSEADVLAAAAIASEGVTLAEFARLARSFGLEGKWLRFPPGTMASELPVHSVVHLNPRNGHFAIFRGQFGRHVGLSDPERGNLLVPTVDFAADWSGVAFLLASR